MGLQEDFEKAAKDALTLPPTTTDESKLILYGLYKQATLGNVNTSRPGLFDLKGKAKWDSWKKVEGKSKDEAKQDYITKVTQLLEDA
jgi:diazepam-binding inhibitor (GABA receptor modulating acyl-CoA-binding protein)